MIWVSAGTPGIAMADVFGRRGALGADNDGLGRQRRFEPVAQLANAVVFGRVAGAWPRPQNRRCRRDFRCRRGGCAPGRRRAAARSARCPAPEPARRCRSGRRSYARTGSRNRRRSRPATEAVLPAACTASQWNSAPCAWAISAISRTGWIDAGLVVGKHHRDQRRPRVGDEQRSERREVDDAVAVDRDALGIRHRRSTDECSTADTSTRARALPSRARWLASVPPLVKMTPSAAAPTSAATAARPLRPAGARRGPCDAPKTGCRRAPAPRRSPSRPRGAAAWWRSSRDRFRGASRFHEVIGFTRFVGRDIGPA